MPAVSKKQQQLFGLVRAVQKGDVPKEKVTSNVRDMAKDTSDKDVEDMATTPTKNLPDKVSATDSRETEEETVNFSDIDWWQYMRPRYAKRTYEGLKVQYLNVIIKLCDYKGEVWW